MLRVILTAVVIVVAMKIMELLPFSAIVFVPMTIGAVIMIWSND